MGNLNFGIACLKFLAARTSCPIESTDFIEIQLAFSDEDAMTMMKMTGTCVPSTPPRLLRFVQMQL
jgi:hypothetical protein